MKCFWIAYAVYMVIASVSLCFFGMYSWKNPDPDSCYVDSETGSASIDPISDTDNIADEWNYWFLVNFWSILTLMAYSTYIVIQFEFRCACFVTARDDDTIGDKILLITLFVGSFIQGASLGWSTSLGGELRFNDEGKICAEALLISSGRFMLAWLIIQYLLLVI